MQIVLVILVGVPASGKTSFAKKIAADRHPSCLHICHDDLIENVDVSLKGNWKGERHKILQLLDSFLLALTKQDGTVCPPQLKAQYTLIISSSGPCLVIVDDNMYYRSMRYEYYQLAKTYNCSFCQVYFKTNLETALLFNSSRENKVAPEIITNIFSKMEPPDSSNVWEKYVLSINVFDDSNQDKEDFDELVAKCLKDPVAPYPQSIAAEHSFNIYHACDIVLRKIISQKLQHLKVSTKSCDLKVISQKLSRRKLDVLKNIKEGKIIVTCSEDNLAEFLDEYISIIDETESR